MGPLFLCVCIAALVMVLNIVYPAISVAALNVMFNSMNKPSQLSGWKSSGGDPCGDDDEWSGIECSGSSVTEMYANAFRISCLFSI